MEWHPSTWINIENVMLSKESQTQSEESQTQRPICRSIQDIQNPQRQKADWWLPELEEG
jgi:hypothetical protein